MLCPPIPASKQAIRTIEGQMSVSLRQQQHVEFENVMGVSNSQSQQGPSREGEEFIT